MSNVFVNTLADLGQGLFLGFIVLVIVGILMAITKR